MPVIVPGDDVEFDAFAPVVPDDDGVPLDVEADPFEDGLLLVDGDDIALGVEGAGVVVFVVELVFELGGLIIVVDDAGAGVDGVVTLIEDGVVGLLLL